MASTRTINRTVSGASLIPQLASELSLWEHMSQLSFLKVEPTHIVVRGIWGGVAMFSYEGTSSEMESYFLIAKVAFADEMDVIMGKEAEQKYPVVEALKKVLKKKLGLDLSDRVITSQNQGTVLKCLSNILLASLSGNEKDLRKVTALELGNLYQCCSLVS